MTRAQLERLALLADESLADALPIGRETDNHADDPEGPLPVWSMRVRVDLPPAPVMATPCRMDAFGKLIPTGPPRLIDAMFATADGLRERALARRK